MPSTACKVPHDISYFTRGNAAVLPCLQLFNNCADIAITTTGGGTPSVPPSTPSPVSPPPPATPAPQPTPAPTPTPTPTPTPAPPSACATPSQVGHNIAQCHGRGQRRDGHCLIAKLWPAAGQHLVKTCCQAPSCTSPDGLCAPPGRQRSRLADSTATRRNASCVGSSWVVHCGTACTRPAASSPCCRYAPPTPERA